MFNTSGLIIFFLERLGGGLCKVAMLAFNAWCKQCIDDLLSIFLLIYFFFHFVSSISIVYYIIIILFF